MISYTMTVGNLLEILTIGIGGLFFLWELRSKLNILQFSNDSTIKHLERLDVDFKELAKVTISIASQQERLNSLEARIGEVSDNLKVTMSTQERRIKAMDELRDQVASRFDNLTASINNNSKEYYGTIEELKDKINALSQDVNSYKSEQRPKRKA